MPKPGWDPPVSVLSKDWSIYGNDAKRLLSWDAIHGVSLSEVLENEENQRICPYPEAGRKEDVALEVHKVFCRQEREETDGYSKPHAKGLPFPMTSSHGECVACNRLVWRIQAMRSSPKFSCPNCREAFPLLGTEVFSEIQTIILLSQVKQGLIDLKMKLGTLKFLFLGSKSLLTKRQAAFQFLDAQRKF